MPDSEITLVEESSRWKKLKKWKCIIFFGIVILIAALTIIFVHRSYLKKSCIQKCDNEQWNCESLYMSARNNCLSKCSPNDTECSKKCYDELNTSYMNCAYKYSECNSRC
ncbi:hypothetical protein CONCODRAFT_13955 [Conidiobolus coronatus NRRL 28638]|uniref:Uncharacterized protein n=1 Tax=Conidiobolus coronatus (strain ATCC 28846 / CBS 209.66 / NRRL 28638) TaxID=796925 RepID=A0A137NPU9_CONC2|nr:hypothetical protein CONCODRAFT_13955 [Conidiobolus coronatus NRRL 28638]|eukprot:KXN64772.1 hypothetical protein CONCODRAFT_13955 [Conidiobolus coronatus NRRL 28638]